MTLLGISTEQLIESLRNARASVKILLLTSTPLSKTIGEGSRWRALPDEYAPIEETPYNSFSADSRANNSDAEADNARTMPPLAHKLTHDTRMSC